MALSQQEIERLCEQSRQAAYEKHQKPAVSHAVRWWVMMACLAVLVWVILVVVAVALG